MPLYLVQHTHTAETCPTKNLDMVRYLAEHVTQATADKFGVKIVADWVDEPQHTVILILEADSADKAFNFAQPFLNVGAITVRAGLTCGQVARACLGG